MNRRANRRLIFASVLGVLIAVAFVPASGAASGRPAQVGAARPVLHAISPIAVPAAGALIAVGGKRLNQVHSVSFGGTVVHGVHNVSATRLTVRAPQHALGQVAVTLRSAQGQSRAVQLSYVRPPAPLHWHGDDNIDPLRGELTDLSCVTDLFCVAVEHNPNTPTRLVRFGTHIAPKFTSIPESADVEQVACGSNHFCVAGPADGAYIWNGEHWTGPTHLGGDHAAGPLCARGTTTCAYYSSSKTLIHSGSGWHTAPLLPGTGFVRLSCASATLCEAILGTQSGGVQFERYDGSSWHVDPAAPTERGFSDIACAPPSYCLAIGDLGGPAYELRGTAWTATAAFRDSARISTVARRGTAPTSPGSSTRSASTRPASSPRGTGPTRASRRRRSCPVSRRRGAGEPMGSGRPSTWSTARGPAPGNWCTRPEVWAGSPAPPGTGAWR